MPKERMNAPPRLTNKQADINDPNFSPAIDTNGYPE